MSGLWHRMVQLHRENATLLPVTGVDGVAAMVPVERAAAVKPRWQLWIDRGTPPLLALGMVSIPFWGLQRTLAVLLANFGYDYRVMMPLRTLSYLAAAKAQGIGLADSQALEMLLHVDTVLLNESWDEHALATLQPGEAVEIICLGDGAADRDPVALIAALQAGGRVIAYYGADAVDEKLAAQADLLLVREPIHLAGTQVRLAGNQPAHLQHCFELSAAVAANRKRGLYLALVPSLINVSGIYFCHFGVITALLVDYSGAAVAIVNALAPRYGGRVKNSRTYTDLGFAPEGTRLKS